MLAIIGIMFSGMFLGYLMRNKKLKGIHFVTTALIWLLLFFLGMEAGANKEVISGLRNIGLEAFAITLAAVGGSILLTWVLWRYINKGSKEEKR
jgi:uncharacterized membrane protein YbjE (DUF340 family)